MIRYLAAAVVLACLPAQACDIEVTQKDGAFSRKQLTAHVGDTLVIRNEGSSFDNAFSVSKAQPFNLGVYPRGASKSISLLHEGTVEIESAMHPKQKVTVKVSPRI
jgi:hypothetical protein